MDILPETHKFDNQSVADAAIYPDGRIVFETGSDVSDMYPYSTAPNWKPDYNNYLENHYASLSACKQLFLYQPTGNCMIGVFKYADTENDYSYLPNKAKPYDKLELAVGFIQNRQGEKIGEKYDKYNSFEEARVGVIDSKKKAEEADKKYVADKKAEIDRKNAAVKKKLVAKYGVKAFNAMNTLRPYVGMPEGIITEMVFYTDVGTVIPYGFSHVNNGYKVYFQSKELAVLKFAGTVKAPKSIYVRNGRVSAVKW